MATDRTNYKAKQVPLNGKLYTSVDGITIGENFKQLVNMRYGDNAPCGISGQTNVITSVYTAGSTGFPHIRNCIFLEKSNPYETHLIVHAYSTGFSEGLLLSTTGSIPISATNTWSGEGIFGNQRTTLGDGIPNLSEGPDGCVISCNKYENIIYAENHFRAAAFYQFDPADGSVRQDYTDFISDRSSDTFVTLNQTGATGYDANTLLMLHMASDLTDSIGTHTATNNGVSFSGGYGTFDGSADYFAIPDHADFNFSGGSWTLDLRVDDDSSGNIEAPIYYQETDDNNYIYLYYVGDFNAEQFVFKIVNTSVTTVRLESNIRTLTTSPAVYDAMTHLAIVEDADDYYMFVDGILHDQFTTTARASNYSSAVYFGKTINASATQFFDGKMDEIRVSDTARWTTDFVAPVNDYGTEALEFYIGSIQPTRGFRFYLNATGVNTATSTAEIYYWDGDTWESMLLSGAGDDGTDSGGAPLGQSGEMRLDAFTPESSVQRAINNLVLHWYKFNIPNIDDGIEIYNIDLRLNTGPIYDVWDGELRTILACLQWDEEKQVYHDHTIGVFEDRYDSVDEGTYGQFTASGRDIDPDDDYILIGSTERLRGLSFYMVSGQENNDQSNMAIDYWDGDSWENVGPITDKTSEDGKTLAKSGFITWNPPAYTSEIKRADLSNRRKPPTTTGTSLTGGVDYYAPSGEEITRKEYKKLKKQYNKNPVALAQFEYAMYWYRLRVTTVLTGEPYVHAYYIGGIPAPKEIGPYAFPVYHNESVWLLSDQNQHKNKIIKSSTGTINVFNGSDSSEFRIGNDSEITGGASMKTVLDGKIYPALIIFKNSETWALYGSGDDYSLVRISHTKGCVAPRTIKLVSLTTEKGEVEVVLFQAEDGIYATNGSNVFSVSEDIDNIWDDGDISSTQYMESDSFYDEGRSEYHWLWTTSGSVHNKEYVLDCERYRWFEIDRGAGARIQCGLSARTQDGKNYTYGMTDEGRLIQLENGLTFATATSTNSIDHTIELGDISLNDNITVETVLRNVGLHMKSKTTANTIDVTHYGDTSDTESTNNNGSAIQPLIAGATGERITIARRSVDVGPHTYHGLKFELTNSTDTPGFEPIYITLMYDIARQGLRG